MFPRGNTRPMGSITNEICKEAWKASPTKVLKWFCASASRFVSWLSLQYSSDKPVCRTPKWSALNNTRQLIVFSLELAHVSSECQEPKKNQIPQFLISPVNFLFLLNLFLFVFLVLSSPLFTVILDAFLYFPMSVLYLRRLRTWQKVWWIRSFRSWRKKVIRARKNRIRAKSCCERSQSISVLLSRARYSEWVIEWACM